MADGGSSELRAYYEAEADRRGRGVLDERRVEVRRRFVDLLRNEHRTNVLDLGAGPGLDGRGFGDAGIGYVGVDLAHGNCRVAADAGVVVVQGDASALPIRPASFAAAWSMSTLMHLPDDQADRALASAARALRPGAPWLIGVWGGAGETSFDDRSIAGERRGFWLRTLDASRELLGAHGVVEAVEVWEPTRDRWPYHVFRLRLP